MLLAGAHVRAVDGARVTVALASEEARRSASDYAPALQRALDHEFRTTLQIEWVVDASLVAPGVSTTARPARRAPAPVETEVEEIDDAGSSIVVDSVADHLITEMFPGAEEVS